MNLQLVKCKSGVSFVVDEVSDKLKNSMNIVFGISVHLYCQHIITTTNSKGTDSFSDYINTSPISICHREDIQIQRDANELEKTIFYSLKSNKKLNSEQKTYLKANFTTVIDNS